MRRSIKALAVTSALVTGLAAAPAPYAHDSKRSSGSMMDRGTIGMMEMTGQMTGMMNSCNRMMQSMKNNGSRRPNDQWRKDAPEADRRPETNG